MAPEGLVEHPLVQESYVLDKLLADVKEVQAFAKALIWPCAPDRAATMATLAVRPQQTVNCVIV